MTLQYIYPPLLKIYSIYNTHAPSSPLSPTALLITVMREIKVGGGGGGGCFSEGITIDFTCDDFFRELCRHVRYMTNMLKSGVWRHGFELFYVALQEAYLCTLNKQKNTWKMVKLLYFVSLSNGVFYCRNNPNTRNTLCCEFPKYSVWNNLCIAVYHRNRIKKLFYIISMLCTF